MSDAGRINLTNRQLELLLALAERETDRRRWPTDQRHQNHARHVLASVTAEELSGLVILAEDELARRQL